MGQSIVGVDIGGTFTDIFWLDEESGACRIAKVPSTPRDPSQGFLRGIREGAGSDGSAALAMVVHGTTVGTNTLLQRSGAPTGLITTAGFRDVLEMRRRDRPEVWGLRGSFTPAIRREFRLEVEERTLADGTIRTPVSPDGVRAAARTLLDAGVESLAIMFINAYANPDNEEAALAAAREIWPNDHITISSRIVPELREFERVSTTVLNAALRPVMSRYLGRLRSGLRNEGFRGDILIVQSNGGVMDPDTAAEIPVRTALSGPAAGVIAGAHIAASAGYDNVITCDMGGTSFDVALVADRECRFAPQTAIEFGLVIRTPMIQITTIGAGGGSIAHVDRGGILQIGPDSAGADPGPVCYGNGNTRPTVTDANVVLGRINAERPLGGETRHLDMEAARKAIGEHVGRPLGLDDMAAAEAIIKVANSRMAGAIRLVSIERGHDPRRFTAMPFGGGGALHAGALINEVGLASAIVPRYPGVTSALGCVIADMRHDFVQTVNTPLGSLAPGSLFVRAEELAREGEDRIRTSGIKLGAVETRIGLDMLYVGQTHSVSVPINAQDRTVDAIRASFENQYREEYGRILDGIPIHIMNLRVSVIGFRPAIDLTVLAPAPGIRLEDAELQGRNIHVDGDWHAARVFERLALPAGTIIKGPAILEQPDATTLIDPGLTGRVDRFGNVIIERNTPC